MSTNYLPAYSDAVIQQSYPPGFLPPTQQLSFYDNARSNVCQVAGQCVQELNVQAPPIYQQPQNEFHTTLQANFGQIHDLPGLQSLFDKSELIIKKQKEIGCCETIHTYEIYDHLGQMIYVAGEDTSEFRCGSGKGLRPFRIRVLNRANQPIMIVNSDTNCCTRETTVEVPPGKIFAEIGQEFALFAPSFLIKDAANGQLYFRLNSPLVLGFGDNTYDILSSDEQTVVAQITKLYRGFVEEAFSNVGHFRLTVPCDMSIVWKAVLLAVVFVVDFQFYEK